jgi:hypothetical protein
LIGIHQTEHRGVCMALELFNHRIILRREIRGVVTVGHERRRSPSEFSLPRDSCAHRGRSCADSTSQQPESKQATYQTSQWCLDTKSRHLPRNRALIPFGLGFREQVMLMKSLGFTPL